MGIDSKYGRVTTERGSIEDDEPVIVIRARDWLAVKTLCDYRMSCAEVGCPEKHLTLISETIKTFTEWQSRNLEKMRVPASESYKP